jgi:hypothetical protein
MVNEWASERYDERLNFSERYGEQLSFWTLW